MYEYPKDLIDFLTVKESEGCEITTTQIVDGTLWIIKEEGLDKWLTLLSWYEGRKDYQLLNICGKGFDRLYRIMGELNT